LEGFESDSSSDSEVGATLTLPPVPKKTNREKKLAKKVAKAAAASVPVPSVPGTIYLGHIPHGFFEKQMHSYFTQFGTITRLRLSRNRRTGKSKHYGWVEFQSKDVAEIVAETMDGYLIHPHRMVCKVVEVDDNVWKGANKVFKKIPWVRINREKLEGKKTKEKWEDLARKDEERMEKRMQKIKDLGIEYDFPTRGSEKRKAEDQVQEVKSKKGKVEKGTKEKRVPSGTTKTKAQK
jgi:nucleolar protein 15